MRGSRARSQINLSVAFTPRVRLVHAFADDSVQSLKRNHRANPRAPHPTRNRMHPYWSLLRLPATAALVWLLLPNAAFFTISATLGFAIVWWLLDLLPPNPNTLRILLGVFYAEQLVPASFTLGKDVDPSGWSYHFVCLAGGYVAHVVVGSFYEALGTALIEHGTRGMKEQEERREHSRDGRRRNAGGRNIASSGRNPHGFSEEDIFELSLQGVKPWEDDAPAVLAVLNGQEPPAGYGVLQGAEAHAALHRQQNQKGPAKRKEKRRR